MAPDSSQEGADSLRPSIHQELSLAGSEDHTFQTSPTTPSKRFLDVELDGIGDDDRDSKRRRGVAAIKEEYLILDDHKDTLPEQPAANDDAAEAFHHNDRQSTGNNSKRREKGRGQNKARQFGSSRDEVGLCSSRLNSPEFSPRTCQFGDKCKFEHDLRRYLKEHKREDLVTFDGVCPVWQATGQCDVGWKCRFVGSHSREVDHGDGRKELVLDDSSERGTSTVVNSIDAKDRILLTKKKYPTPKSDAYLQSLDSNGEKAAQQTSRNSDTPNRNSLRNSSSPEPPKKSTDHRSTYTETPFLPSEKRRLYFGPETPVLAPLTTQGNLPFRRLCTSLGASFTYSEMAMSLPLLQGHKPEWALLRAHSSEIRSPTFTTRSNPHVVYDYKYDQSRDLKFGAQISASKPWTALKATEILTALLPGGLRLVDLNVGCPIDLVYREGAGSALMDHPGKLDRMLRGMNAVSGEVPITVKIRMGTKDKQPTAQKLVERLVLGSDPDDTGVRSNPCGVAAITLHGRSRQQRYTRQADWDYIGQTAGLIKSLNARTDAVTDTIHAPDDRDLPNGQPTTHSAPVFFLGNGDIYSPQHYYSHLASTQCSSLMLARGALIKPWLFSEILSPSQSLLDPSSSDRLSYVKSFCAYGLEAWGADEYGVGTTRRFLLEWLSFACRYVPVGLLERLPPELNERPPKYKGRDELETLMASTDYKDWIKISEMFLGKSAPGFRFEPKHKSNSHEAEG